MYKEASQQKLRVQTSVGNLSVEQLWDLNITQLDQLAVNLEKEYKESGAKSFLTTRSQKDKTAKLKFDIVLDILNTKVEEAEAARVRKETKDKNKKILEIIARKQDGILENKSIRELEKMLEEE